MGEIEADLFLGKMGEKKWRRDATGREKRGSESEEGKDSKGRRGTAWLA